MVWNIGQLLNSSTVYGVSQNTSDLIQLYRRQAWVDSRLGLLVRQSSNYSEDGISRERWKVSQRYARRSTTLYDCGVRCWS